MAEQTTPRPVALGVLSIVFALAASVFAWGVFAFAGSEAYVSGGLLLLAAWVATVATFNRRYLVSAAGFLGAAIALLTGGWGPVSALSSVVPLAMGATALLLYVKAVN